MKQKANDVFVMGNLLLLLLLLLYYGNRNEPKTSTVLGFWFIITITTGVKGFIKGYIKVWFHIYIDPCPHFLFKKSEARH